MDFFLCVIGMVLIFEGMPYFAFPAKMKEWLRHLMEMPDGFMRKFGFLMMLMGLFLLYMGRR